MYKRFSIFIMSLLTLLLISCGSDEGKEATSQVTEKNAADLFWSLEAEPTTMDPQLSSSTGSNSVISNLYEGLLRDFNNEVVLGIAKEYSVSEDGLTYTFNLRESLWSDGEPLTAHDFKYAWLRALDPETASEYAFQLYVIEGAEAFTKGEGSSDTVAINVIDDYTLEVTLENVTPYFVNLVSTPTYFPVREDMVKANPKAWFKDPKTAISNGPFVLSEVNNGELIMKKNTNYWAKDEVALDSITTFFIGDATTALSAYDNGNLDLLDVIPQQEIPSRRAEDPGFHIQPMLGTYYYMVNLNTPGLDDKRVRKALSLAVDRKSITEDVTRGGEIPAAGFVPPSLNDSTGSNFRKTAGNYYIDSSNYETQLEEAKKLLEEAGYPNGEGLGKIEIIYNTSDQHKIIAEAILDMWKANLGVEAELANQEWAVFKNTVGDGKYQVARASWIGDYPDPMTFLQIWGSTSHKNTGNWRWQENDSLTASKKYDELLEIASTTSGVARDKSFYEMEKTIVEEAVFIPIYYYVDQMIVNPDLTDWYKSPQDVWYFGRAKKN